MTSLIARIEAADGPCRELDRLINLATIGDISKATYNTPEKWLAAAERYNWNTPRFTSSIDAAMTLVPEGWRLQLSEWDHEDLRAKGPWQAILERNGTRGDFMEPAPRCDHAKTPALAVCAASRRAGSLG